MSRTPREEYLIEKIEEMQAELNELAVYAAASKRLDERTQQFSEWLRLQAMENGNHHVSAQVMADGSVWTFDVILVDGIRLEVGVALKEVGS